MPRTTAASYSQCMSDDPLHYYVRDKGSAIAHHWDYVRSRKDHALCGHPYRSPVWEGEDRPRAVCRACQALLPPHEARWWRTRAQAALAELESLSLETEHLRARVAELEQRVENQRRQLRQLNRRRATGSGRAPVPGKTKPSGGEAKAKDKPDNSREAVARRLRKTSGPLSAANISAARRRTPSGSVRVVRGGLPGLGKGR